MPCLADCNSAEWVWSACFIQSWCSPVQLLWHLIVHTLVYLLAWWYITAVAIPNADITHDPQNFFQQSYGKQAESACCAGSSELWSVFVHAVCEKKSLYLEMKSTQRFRLFWLSYVFGVYGFGFRALRPSNGHSLSKATCAYRARVTPFVGRCQYRSVRDWMQQCNSELLIQYCTDCEKISVTRSTEGFSSNVTDHVTQCLMATATHACGQTFII